MASQTKPTELVGDGLVGSALDGPTLDAYAWPGGYPIVYYTRDGMTICHLCASDPDTSDPVIGHDIYWEGPAIYCEDGSSCRDDSGPRMIESAYGDPDEESGR